MQQERRPTSWRVLWLYTIGSCFVVAALILMAGLYLFSRYMAEAGEANAAGYAFSMACLVVACVLGGLGVFVYRFAIKHMVCPVERLHDDIDKIVYGHMFDMQPYAPDLELTGVCEAIYGMLERLKQAQVSTASMQRVLNSLDAFLCVSDPFTNKLLFVNDKMRAHFSIQDDAIGKICWQTFDKDKVGYCAVCPSEKLKNSPDEIFTWEWYDAFADKHYRNTALMIEWDKGQPAHLQYCIDITYEKKNEAILQQRLQQQQLMSAMAQSFISTKDMASLIDNALRMAGDFLKVSKILLARYDRESNCLIGTFEWFNEKDECIKPEFTTIPFYPGMVEYDAFVTEQRSSIEYEDIREVPGFEYAQGHGIIALLEVPIIINGELWGILSFDECVHPRVWSNSDIQLVSIMCSVIAGVIVRNRTEEDLLRMSSIVNSSPQFISFVNPSGHFEYLNPAAAKILGYSMEELYEGGIALIFDEQSMQRARNEIIPQLMQGNMEEFEMTVVCKDGTERILSFSGFKTDYKTMGLGSIAFDITEKRELEQALIAAKEQAEMSSQAKSSFLSRMSHEMRTPMNAIIGMTTIALNAEDKEKKDYCLTKIDEASTHLLGVINDILDMSKIEANKFELHHSDFIFEKMLMRVVNVVNFRIDEKKQNLIISLDESVPVSIIGDEQRLSQVIANLLSNSVKFTPEGGSITVSATLQEERTGLVTLLISVTDTGIGISSEVQKKLFTSFEQGDGGVARKYGGTGLGLAICKSIIEQMGGSIWVESQEGKGSTFAFTIQVSRGNLGTSHGLMPGHGWDDLRVLVVDDAPEVLEYFRLFAKSSGFHCETAGDGEQAIRILEANLDNPFRIVFVDWKMPGMNGIELTRKIKEEFGDHVVVIMISTSDWGDLEEEAKEAGVDKFLAKPLFGSLIVDSINECLGMTEQSDEESTKNSMVKDCYSSYRMLLAEDIEVNREIVQSLLEETGIHIDSVENGRDAIEAFSGHPERYDIIFMDIHMPEVDGYEATKRIRDIDIPKAAEIPIIAMTANVFREDIEKCIEAGMNDHIGKPIDVDEMLAKLQKYLPCGQTDDNGFNAERLSE